MKCWPLIALFAVIWYDSSGQKSTLAEQKQNHINFGHLGAVIGDSAVTIGPQYVWGLISYSDTLGLLPSFITGQPVQPDGVKIALTKTLDKCVRTGHPFCRISVEDGQIFDTLVSATFALNPGPKVVNDTISQLNGQTVSSGYLARYLGWRVGSQFNWLALNAYGTQLKKVPFLTLGKDPTVQFIGHGANLQLDLKPKKASSINALVGILPDQDGNILFTGEVDLKLANALSQGEKMSLNWSRLDTASQRLEVNYDHPYLAGSGLGTGLEMNIYKRGDILSFQGDLSLAYMLTKANYVAGFVERREASNNSIDSVAPSVISYSAGVKMLLDLRDQKVNPSKGTFVKLKTGAGQRNTRLADAPDQTTTQLKGELEVMEFFRINSHHVVLLRNRSGMITGDSLVGGEMMRISGANGQRGFDEEALFGSRYTTNTLEYRFRLDEGSFARIFGDVTWMELLNQKTIKPYGFGAGLALGTKAGVVSIDYALGSQQNNPILLKTGKVHVGFSGYF